MSPPPKDPQAEQYGRDLLSALSKQMWDIDDVNWLVDRADMTMTDSRGATALMNISTTGNHELMQKMLVHGALINQKGPRGNTFGHMAAGSGNEAVMSTMLAYGTNFAQPNDAGKTPYDLAQGKYKPETMEKIRQRFEEQQDPTLVRRREIAQYIDENGLRLRHDVVAPTKAAFAKRKPL